MLEACCYCARREHLRRTLVIVHGDATAATAVKCGLNYVVPFVVSNLGLLTGRRRDGSG